MTGTVYTVIRDVTQAECPWLDRDVKVGELVTSFHGHVYGSISANGKAITLAGKTDFVELPLDSIRRADGTRRKY